MFKDLPKDKFGNEMRLLSNPNRRDLYIAFDYRYSFRLMVTGLLIQAKIVFSVGNYLFKVNNEKYIKWNLFKVNNKNTKTTSLTSPWYLYRQLWTCFNHCSGASIVDFEQVNSGWVWSSFYQESFQTGPILNTFLIANASYSVF